MFTVNCTVCCAKDSASSIKFGKTAAGKASRKAYNKSNKAAATKSRYRSTELYVKTTATYRQSEHRKELRDLEYKRIHDDAGRNLEHAIGVVVSRMIKGTRNTSQTVGTTVGFGSRDELVAHFERTFEPGMTMDNHGKLELGKPRRWNVGHRIARDHFDPNDADDVRRCWDPDNLFAQWADENVRLKTKLPPMTELLKLKHCWPAKWGSNGEGIPAAA